MNQAMRAASRCRRFIQPGEHCLPRQCPRPADIRIEFSDLHMVLDHAVKALRGTIGSIGQGRTLPAINAAFMNAMLQYPALVPVTGSAQASRAERDRAGTLPIPDQEHAL
ncbi:MAG: hypothetical protein M0Q42_02025 [Xanthomonadales bacterium]|nr:hypothetical protein [Xanthomonadales bacterium]